MPMSDPEHAFIADHTHLQSSVTIHRRDQRNEAVSGEVNVMDLLPALTKNVGKTSSIDSQLASNRKRSSRGKAASRWLAAGTSRTDDTRWSSDSGNQQAKVISAANRHRSRDRACERSLPACILLFLGR
jgi:hypothetical protein